MGRTRLHAVLTALLTALLIVTTTAVASGPAQAVPGCSGWECNGNWPGEWGCRDDQVKVREIDMGSLDVNGRATIYRSRGCQAAWGEFVFQRDPSDFNYLILQLWSQPQYGGKGAIQRHGSGAHFTLVAGTTKTYRTVMASWDYSVKICYADLYPTPQDIDPDPESTGAGASGGCSNWH
ncbi:hypothetical protein ABT023_04455 [Micromonospora sp. NPDC002296]|uniref:hypothetical protein n=1 Tax=Micromonospora sp. NPDC002296 TaxID=3154271 RepID=UPI00332BEF6C